MRFKLGTEFPVVERYDLDEVGIERWIASYVLDNVVKARQITQQGWPGTCLSSQ